MSDPAHKCPRCLTDLRPGIAMGQTFVGEPEWPGATVFTMNYGGPGVLIRCLKCPCCGHSVTAPTESP